MAVGLPVLTYADETWTIRRKGKRLVHTAGMSYFLRRKSDFGEEIGPF